MLFRHSKIVLLLSVLALSTSSHAGGSVERLMKQMQQQYKLAAQSQTLSAMQPHVAKLQTLTDQATALRYGKTAAAQAQYKDQMHELQADLEELQMAIDAHNLAQAKALLANQIAQTKKAGHKALNVENEEDEENEKQRPRTTGKPSGERKHEGGDHD